MLVTHSAVSRSTVSPRDDLRHVIRQLIVQHGELARDIQLWYHDNLGLITGKVFKLSFSGSNSFPCLFFFSPMSEFKQLSLNAVAPIS